MITEENILEIRLQMEALICKREAMIAENTQRRAGFYDPEVFFGIANRFEELRTTLVTLIEQHGMQEVD